MKNQKRLPMQVENNEQSDKMTILEYEEKYVKRQNTRTAKILLKLIAAVVGVFLFFCLFSITMSVWDKNMYAGIGTAAACVVLYIFAFLVPLVKLIKTQAFITNVNAQTARQAQAHNRKLRRQIADKMIDVTSSVEGVGWYDEQLVGRLAIAVRANDDKHIKENLSALYRDSVKKTAKDIIWKSSLKSAMYSAVSQSNKTDAALVVVVNLQMIKDLVFLYGFRPSDARLIKIFSSVLTNALVAYGLGGIRIGNSVVRTMGDMVKGIPLLGSAISVLVDSSVQGLTNGTLTAVIGYQTIKYLNREYHLQDILDNVIIDESEEELQQTCANLETQLRSSSPHKRPA
jgi:uncharacterized membrane protein YcjF (UPF0283 family)